MLSTRSLFPTCRSRAATLAFFLLSTSFAAAQTGTPPIQTIPGPGNAQAIKTAENSPLVQSAFFFLLGQTEQITNSNLNTQTYDALFNPNTCILHRAGLSPANKQAILAQLLAAGLLNKADDATFPGGLLAGVFPPVLNDPGPCPQLPQRFWSAPGSAFGGHHSYPGGLPIHVSNNDTADINLEAEYAHIYGSSVAGRPAVDAVAVQYPTPDQPSTGALKLDHDLILGAPLWHDWAKSIVFQWNADGTEFQELNIGGSGAGLDNDGAAGDARTGGHHILSIAESMKRGFSPAFIITQASAHSAPTSGNEYKVVNWIRAAAIVAQIDPVAKGFLYRDSSNNLRLPALRSTGEINLNAAGQTNILAEYELHNLSDADFTFSGPAVAADQLVLAALAPEYGYIPSKTDIYNNNFRNVVLSNLSAERLYAIYTKSGLAGVRTQIAKLRTAGKL